MGKVSGDEFSTSIPPPRHPQSLYALVLLGEGTKIRFVRPFVQDFFMQGTCRNRGEKVDEGSFVDLPKPAAC